MYGKIFEEIFDSTLAAEGGWLPTYIFMSMVAIADKDGIVEVAPRALFRKLALSEYRDPIVTYQQFMQALEFLASPDEGSRSPREEGRRILPLCEVDFFDGNRGYLIVNYMHYRRKASKEEKLQRDRENIARKRALEKESEINDVAECSGASPKVADVAHTDTDTDIDTREELLDQFESIWIARPRRAGSDPKKSALSAYRARLKEGHTFAEIQAGYERYRAFCEATGKIGTEWVLRASTFLGPDDHFLNQWEIPKRDGKSKPSYAERCAAAARRHHHE